MQTGYQEISFKIVFDIWNGEKINDYAETLFYYDDSNAKYNNHTLERKKNWKQSDMGANFHLPAMRESIKTRI